MISVKSLITPSTESRFKIIYENFRESLFRKKISFLYKILILYRYKMIR